MSTWVVLCITGTSQQIKEEEAWLKARLQHLAAGEPAAAAVTPDVESDADGAFLTLLRQWRQQRRAAIEGEIARLQQQAVRLKAAAGTGGGSSGATQHAALMQWLEENGAEVRGIPLVTGLSQAAGCALKHSDSIFASALVNATASSSSSAVVVVAWLFPGLRAVAAAYCCCFGLTGACGAESVGGSSC